MERAPVPSGKVATPLTIFNTSNGKDKERDDKGIPASPRTGKMAGILELFCVDVSRSMWLGQTFPYVFGKSKLKVAIDMIDRPATTEWDMQGAEHWSCLVIFAREPLQMVPFDKHTEVQKQRIIHALSNVEHSTGTAIYSAIKLSENLIMNWKKERGNGNDFKVLLHVFTDGIENSSDTDCKAELEAEQELINKDSDPLKHTFLYSFASDFHEVKEVGAKLNATVIMVDAGDASAAMDTRDKYVFKAMNETYRRPSEGAFNLAEGDQPDFVFLHKQLHKALLVFTGDFLKEEGIFRQNASLKDVNVSTDKFAHGQDTLDDYESPIQAAHTFKNVVRRYTIIPKPYQHKIYKIFDKYNMNTDKDEILAAIFSEIKEINKKCLAILLEIISRTVEAQKTLPKEKALGMQGIATVFAGILLSDVIEPVPGDNPIEVLGRVNTSTLGIAFLVDNRTKLLPHPTARSSAV